MQPQQIILKNPKQLEEYQYILSSGDPKKGQGVGDRGERQILLGTSPVAGAG